MFKQYVARYSFRDVVTEKVICIGCYILTTSGEYVVEIVESTGFSITSHNEFEFRTAQSANEFFATIREKYRRMNMFLVRDN